MKLKLISLLLVVVMAFQSITRAGDSVAPQKPKPQIVGVIVAIIAIAVVATIFYQLWHLCQKWLGNPPTPPDNSKKKSSELPMSGGALQINLSPKLSWFYNFTNRTDTFLTPSGTYYTGGMSVDIETSTDLQNWTPCGREIAWFSEDYLAVEQLDVDGNSVYSATVQNWKANGAMPVFISSFPSSDQRFFRQTPTY
jgi:hypothetical protein